MSHAWLNPNLCGGMWRTAQVMLEEFAVAALFVAPSPVLVLLASGRSSGVVLDSGQSTTRACVIYETHLVPHATTQVGGCAYITVSVCNHARCAPRFRTENDALAARPWWQSCHRLPDQSLYELIKNVGKSQSCMFSKLRIVQVRRGATRFMAAPSERSPSISNTLSRLSAPPIQL